MFASNIKNSNKNVSFSIFSAVFTPQQLL